MVASGVRSQPFVCLDLSPAHFGLYCVWEEQLLNLSGMQQKQAMPLTPLTTKQRACRNNVGLQPPPEAFNELHWKLLCTG